MVVNGGKKKREGKQKRGVSENEKKEDARMYGFYGAIGGRFSGKWLPELVYSEQDIRRLGRGV